MENHTEIQSCLDFGAGQCSLEAYVTNKLEHEVEWTNYDPGIDGIDKLPDEKFDLILSSDVLEHIEPDHIADVLDWTTRHAKKYQYHLIACSPDIGKSLPDGRNRHLIVQKPLWWRHQFADLAGNIEFWSHEEVWKRKGIVPYCCILVSY